MSNFRNTFALKLALLGAVLSSTMLATAQQTPYKYTVELLTPTSSLTFQARRVEFGVEAASSWSQGGGAVVKKPVPGPFKLIKEWDESSLEILRNITNGKSFTKVVARFYKPNGKGGEVAHTEIILENAFVTNYQQLGSDQHVGTLDNSRFLGSIFETNELVEVHFVYKTIEVKNLLNGTTFKWDVTTGEAG